MTEKKKPVADNAPSKKNELAITKKKPTTIAKTPKKQSVLVPTSPSDLYQAFDDTFEQKFDLILHALTPNCSPCEALWLKAGKRGYSCTISTTAFT